jgi:ABC-type antimicrobial peptide transport system permease subunit
MAKAVLKLLCAYLPFLHEEQGIDVFRYALKRTSRNWKLFATLLVGVLVASTLFATSNIGANVLITAMLSETLEGVPVDMIYEPRTWGVGNAPTGTRLFQYRQTIGSVPGVATTETTANHENQTSGEGGEYLAIIVVGIQANSTVYQGLRHVAGASTLGANETYLVVDSGEATGYPVGSNYTMQIRISLDGEPDLLLKVTLRVVAYVTLTASARGTLARSYWGTSNGGPHRLVFVTSLEQTLLPLLDYAASIPNRLYSGLPSYILVWLDRATLLNPYDLEGTLQAIRQVDLQIENALMSVGRITDFLYLTLYRFSNVVGLFRLSFLSTAVPVWFIALYLGVTLNDVSFSMRRREVGLLLAKGMERDQVTGLFVLEAVLVGVLASGLGLLIAVLCVPSFLGVGIPLPVLLMTVGVDTVLLTFLFGGAVAALSSYWPARRASQMPTTEALRHYTLAGEPAGSRRVLAWTCLALGTYKLVVWGLGIDTWEIARNVMFTSSILSVAALYWFVFDLLLAFWAPLLFLWGLTTVLVKGSPRFHAYSERFIRRVLGDLGGLAAHTIRRRPGRTAAVIFLTALLVGYSVQTVGVLATHQDLVVRGAYQDVGADIRVTVNYPENVTELLPVVRGIEGVRAAVTEYSFTMYTVQGSMHARAINSSEWTTAAYFEAEWFLPGISSPQALQALADNNRSIILERLMARPLTLGVGGSLSARFSAGGSWWPLEVVGLFGPEPRYDSLLGDWSAEPTWSYVSTELLSDVGSKVSPTGFVLIALDSPAANAAVLEALEGLDDIRTIESAITVLEGYNADILNSATLRFMQMGVLFAFILASVGTLVVVSLTLRERRLSTALMSARGTTYGQTVVMLLAESLTMLLFAILVGLLVGFITLYGLVRGMTTTLLIPAGPALVAPRFLPVCFLPSMLLQIGAVVGLLLLATLVPILIEAWSARHDLSILR